MQAPSSHRLYVFGRFRLNRDERMLYDNDREIPLPPRAVETLVALIERRGEIVSKDDLMTTIWSDTVVEESNLARYIHVLRSTLGKQTDGRPYIETYRRRGYRFNSAVEIVGPSPNVVASVRDFPQAIDGGGGAIREGTTGNVIAVSEWRRDHSVEGEEPLAIVEDLNIEALKTRRSLRFTLLLSAIVVISGAIAATYFSTRYSAPSLTDKDVILIADFENSTDEDVFDKTLRQGLAIQLQQSPFLSLVSDDAVRETLKSMTRPSDTRITREIAREVCLRRGLKVYIVGSIFPLGTRYALAVESVSAASGETVASELLEVASKEETLQALSTISLRLREKLGESLASIEKLATPLEATTSSLDALRLYTQGRLAVQKAEKKDDYERGAILFEQATKLDPKFAIAFMELAKAYALIGKRELIPPVMMRAYELRDTISQRERLSIIDMYHSFITARNDLRLENQELLRELYPRESTAYVGICNLAWFLGQYERAIGECREAVDKGEKQAYTNLLKSTLAAGHFEKAAQIVEEAENADVELPEFRVTAIRIAFVREKYDEVDRRLEELFATPNQATYALQEKGNIAAYKGRAKEAAVQFREAIRVANEKSEETERRTQVYVYDALFKAALGSCAEAVTSAKTAYSIAPMSLYRGPTTWVLAFCGDRTAAMDIVTAILQQHPEGSIQTKSIAPTAKALVALERGDASAAIEHLQSVPRGFESRSFFWTQTARGQAYLKLNRGTEAAAEFQKIINGRGEDPLSPLYPLAYLGLARASAQTGDVAGSLEAYEKFFDLWSDADEDIAPLVEAKREYQKLRAGT